MKYHFLEDILPIYKNTTTNKNIPNENYSFTEGSISELIQDVHARSKAARKACLDLKGYTCYICNFNFEDKYGKIGREFIHVHHIEFLSNTDKAVSVSPIHDLIPVCANCHAMLHKKKSNGDYPTTDELKALIMHNSH